MIVTLLAAHGLAELYLPTAVDRYRSCQSRYLATVIDELLFKLQ
jgi:hypothetical protein